MICVLKIAKTTVTEIWPIVMYFDHLTKTPVKKIKYICRITVLQEGDNDIVQCENPQLGNKGGFLKANI